MSSFLQFLIWAIFFSIPFFSSSSTSTPQVYVVYLGLSLWDRPSLTSKTYIKLLSTVFQSENDAKQALIYSYRHSFSGFAAMLNSTQATRLSNEEGVLSVFRSKTMQLQTTRSWDFLGLTLDQHNYVTPLQLKYGSDIVVGVIDTGVWPESESFYKQDPGPIPSYWKGACVEGDCFDPKKVCNRKLVGAKFYRKGYEKEYGPDLNTSSDVREYRSPRDNEGHGTHTASTAVGGIVRNVDYLGFAAGTARGGAPMARLAVYKVCWRRGCVEADFMAAFDDAIKDGVKVISVSSTLALPLKPVLSKAADIGSFHAAQKGITVVFAAGNEGPDPSLVNNVEPWSISVAASIIDRSFPVTMMLGNNITITAQGFNRKKINTMRVEIAEYYFKDGDCDEDNWNQSTSAKGIAVLCFSITGVPVNYAARAVYIAGGSALIYGGPMTRQFPEVDYMVPTFYVDMNQGTLIYDYVYRLSKSSPSITPTIQFYPAKTVIGETVSAPTVAFFSSRGPNSLSPDILKPDISAPGMSILAAWSPVAPVSPSAGGKPSIDKRSVNWNIISGTSMACPHVAGIVALLKSANPEWSPAAIKSALMTTAQTHDSSSDEIFAGGSAKPADPFDVGAGQANPVKAFDPGLVYDMEIKDYIPYFCNKGLTEAQIASFVLPNACVDIHCPSPPISDFNLNYPAITVSDLRSTTTVKRIVTNVSPHRSIYFVSVKEPDGVQVNVWPRVLLFLACKQKLAYFVTITPLKQAHYGRYKHGEIVWWDGYHRVRSPLSVRVMTDNINQGNEINIDTYGEVNYIQQA